MRMDRKQQSLDIIERVIKAKRLEHVSVQVANHKTETLRFSGERIISASSATSVVAMITAGYDKKSATVSVEVPELSVLEPALQRAEALAQAAQPSAEYMPPVAPPQSYLLTKEHFESTAQLNEKDRAHVASTIQSECKKRALNLAAYIQVDNFNYAFGNSSQLRVSHSGTKFHCSATARTLGSAGSAKAQEEHADFARFNLERFCHKLVTRAELSANPHELPPGEYPAIIEPSALCGFMSALFNHISRRAADEGRSYFSLPGGKNKIGQALFNSSVNLTTSPCDELCPTASFGAEGLALTPISWIESGTLKNLPIDRYWASKLAVPAIPMPANFILQGGSGSLEDLIKNTERAVLISQSWYMRDLDPKEILVTGLTRDGTFWVEDGKIQYPIKNFRFNESPVRLLQSVDALSASDRCIGTESWGPMTVLPAIRVPKFNFSTISDAI